MADAQCERDALGAALTYNQLLDSLSPELFRDPSCSAIFTAARAVRSAGGEADVVGVMAWSAAHQAGISPEALPYVFQRFYKEDQSRGLHARGAGLGLNICKVLVNLSGGQIRVESKQGEWCRFVFTLPVQPPNPGGMKRLPDESGRPGAVEDPASMKPVD